MADSKIIGKGVECTSEAKRSSEYGYKVGEALAGYYAKKYPRYDRQKIYNAIMSGLYIGSDELKTQGGSQCPQAIKQANKLFKKYGTNLRY